MTFASAATTAARVAAVLGWSPAIFWSATPADLRAAPRSASTSSRPPPPLPILPA